MYCVIYHGRYPWLLYVALSGLCSFQKDIEWYNPELVTELMSLGCFPPQWFFNEIFFSHPLPPSSISHLPQLVLLHPPRLAVLPCGVNVFKLPKRSGGKTNYIVSATGPRRLVYVQKLRHVCMGLPQSSRTVRVKGALVLGSGVGIRVNFGKGSLRNLLCYEIHGRYPWLEICRPFRALKLM